MTSKQPKQAYRNQRRGMIGGVCEGLGEFFEIDPLIFRAVFIALLLAGGSGVLIYVVLWIVLPEKQSIMMEEEKTYRAGGETTPGEPTPNRPHKKKKNNGSLIGGLVLIVIGGLFLLDRLLPEIRFKDYWPLILIVIGIVLVVRALQGKDEDA